MKKLKEWFLHFVMCFSFEDEIKCDCCKKDLIAGSYPFWFCLNEECLLYKAKIRDEY